MNDPVDDPKAALRRDLRRAVAAITPEEHAEFSALICQRLRELPRWRDAATILAFCPLADEPNLEPLITEAFAAGRRLAFPRFDAITGGYEVCLARSWDELAPGRFGVLEPAACCPRLMVNQLDFALVPGIGFSLVGDRLGRGKGYYDRLLAGIPGFRCGVAFDCQLVTSLPVEPHDVRLNGILTPTRWQLIGPLC
jgi:5-formyltetrahydrofolate cyclo-ligase